MHGVAEMCTDLPVFQIRCTVHERHDSQAAANTEDMHTHTWLADCDGEPSA